MEDMESLMLNSASQRLGIGNKSNFLRDRDNVAHSVPGIGDSLAQPFGYKNVMKVACGA
jgi:hypothetical protein